MKTKTVCLICMSFSLFLYQCTPKSNQTQFFEEQSVVQEEERFAEIDRMNEQAREEARQLRFSDTDFLQTKQPMSDDAIAPYDYHTGIVGDKAYNQVVYIQALERVKKHLILRNNKLVMPLQSGAEINMAEDLFQFIIEVVINSWNGWVEEGIMEIVKTDEGYYDIAPCTGEK